MNIHGKREVVEGGWVGEETGDLRERAEMKSDSVKMMNNRIKAIIMTAIE